MPGAQQHGATDREGAWALIAQQHALGTIAGEHEPGGPGVANRVDELVVHRPSRSGHPPGQHDRQPDLVAHRDEWQQRLEGSGSRTQGVVVVDEDNDVWNRGCHLDGGVDAARHSGFEFRHDGGHQFLCQDGTGGGSTEIPSLRDGIGERTPGIEDRENQLLGAVGANQFGDHPPQHRGATRPGVTEDDEVSIGSVHVQHRGRQVALVETQSHHGPAPRGLDPVGRKVGRQQPDRDCTFRHAGRNRLREVSQPVCGIVVGGDTVDPRQCDVREQPTGQQRSAGTVGRQGFRQAPSMRRLCRVGQAQLDLVAEETLLGHADLVPAGGGGHDVDSVGGAAPQQIKHDLGQVVEFLRELSVSVDEQHDFGQVDR